MDKAKILEDALQAYHPEACLAAGRKTVKKIVADVVAKRNLSFVGEFEGGHKMTMGDALTMLAELAAIGDFIIETASKYAVHKKSIDDIVAHCTSEARSAFAHLIECMQDLDLSRLVRCVIDKIKFD